MWRPKRSCVEAFRCRCEALSFQQGICCRKTTTSVAQTCLGNGLCCSQFGVFLDGVALFDPAALGIGDAEAALMDPQQRLLLETASEAMLAHPAEAADEQLRSNWGVFVVSLLDVTRSCAGAFLHHRYLASIVQGVSSNDYHRVASKHMLGAVTAYSATGIALSVVSGRLSYTMRLKGPAVSVDTGRRPCCSCVLSQKHWIHTI